MSLALSLPQAIRLRLVCVVGIYLITALAVQGQDVPEAYRASLDKWRDTTSSNSYRVEAITQLVHGLRPLSDLEALRMVVPGLSDTTTTFARKQLSLVDLGRGNLLAWFDRCDEALPWFERARARMAPLSDTGMLAQCDALSGFTLKNAGRLGEATGYALRAIRGYTTTQDSAGLVEVHHDLGYIFGAQGDVANGVVHYTRALEVARRSFSDYHYPLCMRIAELENARGNRQEALAWIDSAKVGLPSQPEVEYGKSDIPLLRGEMALQDGLCDSALSLFSHAFEAQADHSDRVSWRSTTWSLIARAHLCARRYQSAIAAAKKGLGVALSQRLYKEQLDNLTPLAEAQEALHDATAALETRKRISVLEDSLMDPGALTELTSGLISAEFERKQTESEYALDQERSNARAKDMEHRMQRVMLVTMIGFVILFAGVLFIRARSDRSMQLEELRTRLSRDLHDDIGSTLSSINILSTVARRKAEAGDETGAAASLSGISERTQRLMRNMSDIVWSVDPDKDTLEELLTRMREFGAAVLEPKGITFRFDSIGELGSPMPAAMKSNLYLIFKEAVNNAAKHAQATEVVVSFTRESNRLRMTIADNGNGMEIGGNPASTTGGNGLRNMHARALEMKADLSVNSVPQQGTTIGIVVPL